MNGHDNNDDTIDSFVEYSVVMNHEEQYSIWPVELETPAGWTRLPVTGAKDACLEHIERVWTDMRPLSLRRSMDADGSASRP